MMCPRSAPLALVLFVLAAPATASWVSPFISEFHYDNAGADVGEFVAVTGPAGWDLSGWQLVLYNGANGQAYRSLALGGRLGDGHGGLAETDWPVNGLQNGPDALALVADDGSLVDFVAYEAQVTALDGLATGSTARRVPVSEGSATPPGHSLQRIGGADDWDWIALSATPGVVNPGLGALASASVAAPGSGLLCLSGLLGWRRRARRRAGGMTR